MDILYLDNYYKMLMLFKYSTILFIINCFIFVPKVLSQDEVRFTIQPDSMLKFFSNLEMRSGYSRKVNGVYLTIKNNYIAFELTIQDNNPNGIMRAYNDEGIMRELAHFKDNK